jgi:hypothetical protein
MGMVNTPAQVAYNGVPETTLSPEQQLFTPDLLVRQIPHRPPHQAHHLVCPHYQPRLLRNSNIKLKHSLRRLRLLTRLLDKKLKHMLTRKPNSTLSSTNCVSF